jgi:hypothetical protein
VTALAFIGDGERDKEVVPRLVSRVLGRPVVAIQNETWRDIRLHGGTGFDRKLAFVVAAARTDGLAGVVATVDQDTVPGRLAALVKARELDRQRHLHLPIALGEARPHGEAWLLDDPSAVRDALGIDSSVPIPAPHKCASPKTELIALLEQSRSSGERPLSAFPRIAESIDPQRCAQRERTGFAEFLDDLRREFRDETEAT